MDRKTKAIQEIRDLIAKPMESNQEIISLEIKKKADEIFGCLTSMAAIVGGGASQKMDNEIEQLQEQWLWLVNASNVFHLGLNKIPQTEWWLTNANTVHVRLDGKRKLQVEGKINPISGDVGGGFSLENR